jgi:hypothetical protein
MAFVAPGAVVQELVEPTGFAGKDIVHINIIGCETRNSVKIASLNAED